MSAGRRHVLDAGVRRSGGGKLLVGGSPGRLFRLSPAGAPALDAILAGASLSPPAAALAERLRAAGTIHPLAEATGAGAELTFVVPVRDGGPGLAPLVEALGEGGEVIVVDDRSRDGSAARARAAGARVIANTGRPGPAGARNTGLAAARTELIAFVDADCVAGPDWARALAGLFVLEPELALAAPRVRGARGEGGALGRYESSYSPLDQGAAPSLVGPGRRVGFLPAAALVGRREALAALGGFDEELRVGEDVDLILRLLEAGARVRYAPEVAVAHRPRTSLGAFARQRFSYAASAAALELRHPGAVAPARLLRPTIPSVRGTDAGARRALASAAARAQLASAAQLPRLASREWLPPTLLLAARHRRGRALLVLALLADLKLAARPGGEPLGPPLRAALRLLDNAAYAAGAWSGAARHRTLRALLPRVL